MTGQLYAWLDLLVVAARWAFAIGFVALFVLIAVLLVMALEGRAARTDARRRNDWR